MNLDRLPFDSALESYQQQAADLLDAFRASDPDAIAVVGECDPRFLDQETWTQKEMTEDEIVSAGLETVDAQEVVARWYEFESWAKLSEYVAAVTKAGFTVHQFESAIEAIINGELPKVRLLIRRNPDLVYFRSRRVTPFEPPVHRATLLHYVAANGVESYRQIVPPNAVEIAEAILEAGADVDALADMYGGKYSTLSLLVSSAPPAQAGVQIPLVELLLDYGAEIEGKGGPTPLMTALAFGYTDTARTLADRGAKADRLAAAAGLGRLEEAQKLISGADELERHIATALAAQHGHADILALLLDAGEDPDRYNPSGFHPHSTPLHQAAIAGREDVVRLLVERGARLDLIDEIYQGTPLVWAEYGGEEAIAEYLRLAAGEDQGAIEA